MADKEAQLARYVDEIASLVGLAGWKIEVDVGTSNNNFAECTVCARAHRAYISFRHDWVKESPSELADTVLHELLHCHLQPIDDTMAAMRNSRIGSESIQVVESLQTHLLESVVDSIAGAWAPLLPQPDFLDP